MRDICFQSETTSTGMLLAKKSFIVEIALQSFSRMSCSPSARWSDNEAVERNEVISSTNTWQADTHKV